MLEYPVLKVVDNAVGVFRSHDEFMRTLAITTDRALKRKGYESAVIVDSKLQGYRIVNLVLKGKKGIFGWLKPRVVERFEIDETTLYSLSGVKGIVADAIDGSEYWSEYHPEPGDLMKRINAAKTFGEIVALFG